ncbi:unnamed protein product [Pleuronectes platessa]|uniref:Uncharacterized protein n=1 Tax=Pleuronectes platessa TaxID=8262 RepID=A0A9N7YFL1_PLEPL|nr:unnamed protein product [Pleuronectes platessa]
MRRLIICEKDQAQCTCLWRKWSRGGAIKRMLDSTGDSVPSVLSQSPSGWRLGKRYFSIQAMQQKSPETRPPLKRRPSSRPDHPLISSPRSFRELLKDAYKEAPCRCRIAQSNPACWSRPGEPGCESPQLPSAAPQWEQWELELVQQQHPSTLLSRRLEVSRGSLVYAAT